MEIVRFKCCKHLDHDVNNYTGCILKSCRGHFVYWERGPIWADYADAPIDVQFCKKRGRLNFKSACISGGGGECSHYSEEERIVTVL